MTIHRSGDRISERGLCELLGVDQRVVAEFRKEHLEVDLHWVRFHGQIEYTPEGVDAVRKKTGAEINARGGPISPEPPSSPADGTDRGASKEPAAAAVTLEVGRCCPNPTWVKAWMESENRWVDVRVKNNRGMRPGFKMRGCVPDRFGRMTYAGKCPYGART